MKKLFAVLTLTALSLSPVFAGTSINHQTQQSKEPSQKQTTTPATRKPIETKKISEQSEKPKTPMPSTQKSKMMLISDEKSLCSPTTTADKNSATPEKKEMPKTPSKSMAPKIALS